LRKARFAGFFLAFFPVFCYPLSNKEAFLCISNEITSRRDLPHDSRRLYPIMAGRALSAHFTK